MNCNSSLSNDDYDNFINKYHKISWRYARYYLEYDNMLSDYNNLKKNIIIEYENNFKNLGHPTYVAKELALNNINSSVRLNLKKKKLLLIQNYIEVIEMDYNKYYNYYNNKV